MSSIWIPSIEVESAHGTREVSLVTRHLMNRRIFLTGEVNSETANIFNMQLLYLEEDSTKPVTIYINSPGGEIDAGLVIYDAIQGSRLDINMICTGMAASMAAVILAGGQKGRRFILKHSRVMIHEPLIAGGVGGSATAVRNISDSIIKTRELLNGILAEHTGNDIETINKATSFDNYMDAESAVSFGVCDKIVDSARV